MADDCIKEYEKMERILEEVHCPSCYQRASLEPGTFLTFLTCQSCRYSFYDSEVMTPEQFAEYREQVISITKQHGGTGPLSAEEEFSIFIRE